MADKKTILITGAGTGFGRDAAFILARQGHEVIATVEVVAQIHDLSQAADAEDLSLRVEKLDVTNENDRLRAADWDIDVLINNGGISEGGAVVDLPEDVLRRQFEVNVFGQVLLTQLFARQFIEKTSGKIVFISSIAGLSADAFTGAYSGSKHALEAFALALEKELEEFGVQVATVNPGPFLTGFNDRMFDAPSHWHPEDVDTAVFNYEKLAFPLAQFDPAPVGELIAKVATGEIDTYRNLIPKAMEADIRKGMDALWTQKVITKPKRNPSVDKAYEMEPGTPAED